MKHIWVLVLIFVAVACTRQPIACTADAKICPDGTAVGRDPLNNCEFKPCPEDNEKPIPVDIGGGIGISDPYTRYASTDTEECKSILFQCIEGSSPFYDDTGCGCKADEPKTYISEDLDECSRIKYMCIQNTIPFTDEKGCGCEFTFEQENLPAYDCNPEQRGAICTKEYDPVCGWFSPDIQCIKYPCAADYGNKCMACADEIVAYYTEGKCPSDSSFELE